jgi:CheY-like chemotaxis protein
MEDLSHSRTVLIVDDDQGLISLIQRCLSREGFHTAIAHSGEDALSWLSHHHADLLLLDLQLADMSGEDLIHHLNQRALTIPFIVITGQGNERLAVMMMKQGARDYFIKNSSFIKRLPTIVTQTFEHIHQEQQLLTFAKRESPLKKLLSLQHVVSKSAMSALSGSSIHCQCDIPENMWPIHADEGHISRVIHNVATNAQQAMPTGGTLTIYGKNVTLTAEQVKQKNLLTPGDFIQIFIQDTGHGIPAHTLRKVFDPYFTTQPPSSGLGLSTAYSIIKNHGGTITASSIPGEGSTFVIYLPAAQQTSTVPHISPLPSMGDGRVLVMDDEESIRLMLGEMLRHLGYEVHCVAEGNEALERYQEAYHARQPFKAVILDLTVKRGLGGKDTMQQLRAFDPHVKAIVASGYCNDTVLKNYARLGFDGVVAKPFQLTELSQALNQITA